MDNKKYIKIRGAAEHNLKNIDIDIPRDEFVVLTGLSGSGKSSLAFDTIYAEGQRRYMESLSSYARQFLGQMEKPQVESLEGLPPAISIDQKSTNRNPRSTVGTVTEIYDYLRLLFARAGIPHCPKCIHDQIQDLYGIEMSAEMVSKITDKILPEIKEWQSRPLNPIYPFVFMDCIHYKVREDGRVLSRAAYIVLGVTVEGYKDILSITVGANETSKFWLGMLNDLKNRGVKDVLFFCVDGLPGFKEAIQAVYPQAEIQRCVIHMLRNSFKYVNYNDLKKFSSDFKAVYNAPNETAGLSELENLKEKWGKKYPYAISNWENNWEDVSSFFQFSGDIRRIMYTTNIIEGLNRQYRKVTKTKSVFPSDVSLEKMLYLASGNVIKKWTQRYRNWDQVLNQLIVLYDERLTQYL